MLDFVATRESPLFRIVYFASPAAKSSHPRANVIIYASNYHWPVSARGGKQIALSNFGRAVRLWPICREKERGRRFGSREQKDD